MIYEYKSISLRKNPPNNISSYTVIDCPKTYAQHISAALNSQI